MASRDMADRCPTSGVGESLSRKGSAVPHTASSVVQAVSWRRCGDSAIELVETKATKMKDLLGSATSAVWARSLSPAPEAAAADCNLK